VEVIMLLVTSRLGILLLLICDYWGDPGLALSPLARPFCSTPTHCPTLGMRDQVELAIKVPAPPAWGDRPEVATTAKVGRVDASGSASCDAASPAPSSLCHLSPRLQL
jgi:hypothetical protein